MNTHRGTGTAMLVATVFFAASPAVTAATDVPAGSDLAAFLNAATAAEHTYNLLGDVNMSDSFSQPSLSSNTSRDIIIINGNGHTITRTGNHYRFNISRDGSELTINNATITGSAALSGGYGVIYVTADDAFLDLDGVVFYKNTAGTGYGILEINASDTLVTGAVSFTDNVCTGSEVATVHVNPNASLTFDGPTYFSGNSTGFYGGAVAVRESASIRFREDAVFEGNHATAYFGGAIDLYGGNSSAVFEKDVTFTNNYVKNTTVSNHTYGVRGGAINVGYTGGSKSPQLELLGTSTFASNYVWGTGSSTRGLGGAISLVTNDADPFAAVVASEIYGANIARGIFQNNYAYSDNGGGYGGAIFARSYNATLSLGSGSSFTGNASKTLGGAIYFDQGTLNLTGNINFSGNYHGASFSTASGRPVYTPGSGTPNAIYFAVSSNTATMNLATAAGERIDFHDPIASNLSAAAAHIITINKTGAGEVAFYQHDSTIRANVNVTGGAFHLADAARFGHKGTAANSSFTVGPGATLHASADSLLRAWQLQVNGILQIDAGAFHVDAGSTITLGNSSVLSLTIRDADTYSRLVLDTSVGLTLNGSSLAISASGYVPSEDLSDVFTLITGASQLSGTFAQGDHVSLNGAEFEIVYLANSVLLRQLTAPIPEPASYVMLAGLAMLVWVGYRRQGCSRGHAARVALPLGLCSHSAHTDAGGTPAAIVSSLTRTRPTRPRLQFRFMIL